MADYAIGGSFIKTNRTLIRIVPLQLPNRYFGVRDANGFVTLPTLNPGDSYIELQGATKATLKFDDTEKEFRLFGDNGWADSVTMASKATISLETFFQKKIVEDADGVPVFRGDYSDEFQVIERSRYDKDTEVYMEVLKEMGRLEGASGPWIYDFVGFNGCIRNMNDPLAAEELGAITCDFMSRGRPVVGRYNAGSTQIPIGQIQSSLLSTSASSGTRRYAVVPADNASGVAVTSTITVTYTSNGTLALDQLKLPAQGGAGFQLEAVSSGVIVPATATLGGAGSNVVTITPAANLSAGTIYRLKVVDGAIVQLLDSSGAPSASGLRRPLAGFSSTFRTA
jgi:hypothetical protein